MRKLHIFTLLAAFLIIIGCTEEKDFYFYTTQTANVNFKAVNLTVGYPDSALSVRYDGYFDEVWAEGERRDSFSIDYYRINEWDGEEEWMGYINFELNYKNVLWSGGYNQIEFTFLPSCPEEKEAKFTMPDGQVFNVTADNPTFKWTVSKEKWTESNLWEYNRLIATAESTYQRGGNTISARGYVIISLSNEGNYLRYNSYRGKWYWDNWEDNPVMTFKGNVDFTVENLTVGSIDFARSEKIVNDYYPSISREPYDYFSIDIYDLYDSVPEYLYKEDVYLQYTNRIWAAGDNQLKITFHPSEDEPKGATFILPDGKEVFLQALEDRTYVWTLDRETMANINMNDGRIAIVAWNNYSGDDGEHENRGVVEIDVATDIRYESDMKLRIPDYWTEQTR